jgi:hypothetical protein
LLFPIVSLVLQRKAVKERKLNRICFSKKTYSRAF